MIIAGDGIVARSIEGHRYEARPSAQLPTKVLGEHRWVALASYVLTVEQAATAMDADTPKFLDHENLFHIGIGCWDCEQYLGQIEADSRCSATESM